LSNTLIKSIATLTVQLPTRREHKWTGLTEPIGRYVLAGGGSVVWVDRGGSDSVAWASAPAASSATVLTPPLTRRPSASPDVIGLFPEPGALR
jgi:hypothetical protein